MKSRTLTCITAIALFAVMAITTRLAAQDKPERKNKHHHYQLIDIGTFGGAQSYGIQPLGAKVLNNHGTLAGWADTSTPDPYLPGFCFDPDCLVSHAFQWQEGVLTDLGALPGGGSSQAVWIASNSLIVGNSQNGETDPLIPGLPEGRGVLWQDRQIVDLGTFGGNESMASAVNSRGQVVGSALNTTPDPFSLIDLLFYSSSNGTQTRAFLWQDGEKQDLGTLGSGNDALAFYVNEAGQVAGFAYTNSSPNSATGLPTFHPFLWDKQKGMQDLGTLGGTIAQAVNGLNERGEVVGSTTLAGDMIRDNQFLHHPFLWNGKRLIDLGTFGGPNGEADWINDAGDVVGIAQRPTFCSDGNGGVAFLWSKGVLHDLGTPVGITNSEALGINSKTQIVGDSFICGFSVVDAFIWEKGSIADLNTLIPVGSTLHLFLATYINDRGEITGLGVLPNGDMHAFLLIPCREGTESCGNEATSAPATKQSNSTLTVAQRLAIRRMMAGFRARLAQRYQIPRLGVPRD